ncbi:AraC family transcriptional regulator [Phenylobacterium sp.]|uniref:helix-turn-helix transcriptional regulator n=1 Tax=Phenylobacterium sp. TaxID=1871053 RepID=UPI00120FBB42|nr:AraC family transcriptional regulator [Phenylobacterium sp.]THD60098.1 MAG: AraC family transcriptional regulator [Phenylobacterium sp.]
MGEQMTPTAPDRPPGVGGAPPQALKLGETLGVRAPVVIDAEGCEAGQARCVDPSTSKWENCYRSPCIGVVTSGVFNYRSSTNRGTVAPGTVLFGNLNEEFSCEHLDTVGNRRAYVALNPALVEEVANACEVDSVMFTAPALEPSPAATVLYGMVAKIVSGRAANEESLVDLTAAALRLDRRHGPPPISLSQRARVIELVYHLEDTFTLPWSLAELSEMAGLSRYHFIRVFREVTGASPRQYLISARMRAATDRLLTPAEPVTSVALAAGFNDISHFNNEFRKVFGVSPSQWRRAACQTGRDAERPRPLFAAERRRH